jgi:8-oxo-dGTP diphosphatase
VSGKYAGQKIRVVTAEVRRDGEYLITQRLPTSILPLLWEFPGGRVREGETPESALTRLLEGKLGVGCEIGELVMEVVHEYDHYTVDMQVFRCFLPEDADISHTRIHDHRWVPPADFGSYEFPSADEATITALLGLAPPEAGDDFVN